MHFTDFIIDTVSSCSKNELRWAAATLASLLLLFGRRPRWRYLILRNPLPRYVYRTCGECWWGEAFSLESDRSNCPLVHHEAHGGSCSSQRTIASDCFAFQDFLLKFDEILAPPQSGEMPEALGHCVLGFQTSDLRQWHYFVIFTCFSSQSFPFKFFFMYTTMAYRFMSSWELPI